jgi:hypothetical protein
MHTSSLDEVGHELVALLQGQSEAERGNEGTRDDIDDQILCEAIHHKQRLRD